MNYQSRFIQSIIIVLVFCGTCISQVTGYHYKRQLKIVNNGWQQVVLPEEMYGRLNTGLTDLRVIKIEGSDTLEVPYISSFHFRSNEQSEQYFSLINKTHSKEGYFYTYKVPSARTLNRINIKTELDNFDWRVNLEGSNDNISWYTIVGNYRITSFSNRETSFSYTDIKFQDCEFRYYRLQVKTNTNPEIDNVAFMVDKKIVYENGNYQGVTFLADNDKKEKLTVIDIILPLKVPVSEIFTKVLTEGFFYRPFTLQYLVDSVKTTKGWLEQYEYSVSGAFDSRTKNEFFLPEVITNKFRITIENFDNQPLTFSSIEIRKINHWLLFSAAAGGTYELVYGNSKARLPDYDIAKNFEDGTPLPQPKGTAIGEEEVLRAETMGRSSGLSDKILLYSIMGVGIILLGIYLIRMLKHVK